MVQVIVQSPGNIVFGGLIGMLIVDPATGAMFKLPETLSADLGQPVAAAKISDLQIVSIDSITPAQRAALVPVD